MNLIAKLNFVGLLMLTFLLNSVNAQPPTTTFRGLTPKYGDGRDGTNTVSLTLFTDEQRAKVTDVSVTNYGSGTWPWEYTISHNADHGDWTSSGIASGDVLILFQAYQTKDKNNTNLCTEYDDEFGSQSAHFFLYVTSVSSGQVVCKSDVDINNTLIPTAIDADDMVQVQRVHQYQDLVLQANSVVTCNAWDGETGGLCVLMISGQLQFLGDNIVFNANEKGFAAGQGNPNHGANNSTISSPGAAGTSTNPEGGDANTQLFDESNDFNVHFTLSPSCTDEFGAKGGYGAYMIKGGNPAVHDIKSTIGCLTTEPYFLNMGSGGYGGEAGLEGAASGGAGGGGGYGAGTTAATVGGTPTQASTGNGSGAGGNGGKGGGLICIWAYEYDYNSTLTTNEIFQAKGGNATNGEDGDGIGGNGGNGGRGGDGKCNGVGNYDAPGGGGQFGMGGNGADAGSGGDAGLPGFIRFYYYNHVNNLMDQATVCQVDPGYRGIGGNGDAHGTNGSYGADGSHDFGGACNSCYEIEYTYVEECNCAKAFATIGDMGTGTLTYDATSGTIFHSGNASFDNNLSDEYLLVEYLTNYMLVTTQEVTTEGSNAGPIVNREVTVTKYRCNLSKIGTTLDYNPIPVMGADLTGTFSGSWVANGTSVLGNSYEFENDGTPQLGDFQPSGGGFPLASGTDCEEAFPAGPGTNSEPRDGLDGKGGKGRAPVGGNPTPYQSGDDYTTNFDANNVYFGGGEPPIPPLGIADETKRSIEVYPNPATDNLVIQSKEVGFGQITKIEITDLQGKTFEGASFKQNDAQVNVTGLDKLPNGTYLIRIITESVTYMSKFIIER